MINVFTRFSVMKTATVDDLMVYPFAQDDYLLVVNAANKDKDFAHIEQSLEIGERVQELTLRSRLK